MCQIGETEAERQTIPTVVAGVRFVAQLAVGGVFGTTGKGRDPSAGEEA